MHTSDQCTLRLRQLMPRVVCVLRPPSRSNAEAVLSQLFCTLNPAIMELNLRENDLRMIECRGGATQGSPRPCWRLAVVPLTCVTRTREFKATTLLSEILNMPLTAVLVHRHSFGSFGTRRSSVRLPHVPRSSRDSRQIDENRDVEADERYRRYGLHFPPFLQLGVEVPVDFFGGPWVRNGVRWQFGTAYVALL